MSNLIEAYKNRLALSESVYQKAHNGEKMSAQKKLMIASVLHNTSKFLNEAFTGDAATQRSSMGDFKKFCLNISTVALPNLILPELMIVQPMSSLSGYVTYLRYTAGTDKGGVGVGDTFNGVYGLGKMTPDRVRYTSAAVSELHTVKATEEVSGGKTTFNLDWYPIISVKDIAVKSGDTFGAPLTQIAEGTPTTGQYIVDKQGKVVVGDALENGAVLKIRYLYDNEIIPQTVAPVSLPTLTAKMQAVNLHQELGQDLLQIIDRCLLQPDRCFPGKE